MVAFLLSPVAPVLQNDGGKLAIKIEQQKVLAAFKDDFIATVTHSALTSGSVDIDIVLESTRDGAYWDYINANKSSNLGIATFSGFQVALSKTENPFVIDGSNYNHPTWSKIGFDTKGFFSRETTLGSIKDTKGFKVNLTVTRGDLIPDTTYYARFTMEDENKNDVLISNLDSFKTLSVGQGEKPKDSTKVRNAEQLDFACGALDFSVSGCVANLTVLIWQVTSWIAHLGGSFLDFFVYYSTNSNSFKNAFISEGWGAVRDVANIFFIIALLYVAIKMILGLGGHDSKKIIIMVVLMALLINFSLFFSEVVIDSSNILAKVFYNNIEGKDSNGNTLTGAAGEKSISIGIMDKFNPQKLISQDTYDMEGGHGKFIFVTILCIFILLYAAYVFFSVAILFVSRVVSLWIYMIFAPIAFVSYTLPFKIPGFGHEEWWKELLGNAFMAPIFVFFLFIIIKFANFLKDAAIYPDNADTIQKLMSVVIPFAVIAILLKKSKDLVVKLSGEMGAAVMGAAAVVGGLALGGAALGVAAVGRGTVGKIMKKASTSDAAANYEAHAEVKKQAEKDFRAGTITKAQMDARISTSKAGLGFKDITFGKMGHAINKSQNKVEEAQHARHELDKEAEAKFHGKKFKELSGTERRKVLENVSKDEIAMKKHGKAFKNLSATQKTGVDTDFATATATHKTKGEEYLKESKHKQGIRTTLLQSARTGTWDARNLSTVTASEYDKTLNKFASGLTSVVGSAMRGSIKSTMGAQYGTGQGKFFKDLGHTISEAMKGAKVNVDLSHVGEEHKEGSHGHGGGGGGHH